MGIGTSLGAFYDDEHHYAASQWDDKYDNNIVTPDQQQQNKQLEQIDQTELGGTPVNFLNSPDEIMEGVEGAHSLPAGNAMSGPGKAETVGKAALQYKGETYEGQNHGLALGDIMDKYGSDISMRDIKDGFTTSKGRFVSREEAFDIAKSQNQIKDQVLPALTEDSKMLLSEDLKGRPDMPSFSPKGRPYKSPDSPIAWPFSGPEPDLKTSPVYNHDAHVEWRGK